MLEQELDQLRGRRAQLTIHFLAWGKKVAYWSFKLCLATFAPEFEAISNSYRFFFFHPQFIEADEYQTCYLPDEKLIK